MDLTIFFFKQKTAYEMRISDWSSDVCSSDLASIVAMSGAIIPEPLQKPLTVTVLPSIWQVAVASLGKVSVVRIAFAAAIHPSPDRAAFSFGNWATSFSAGRTWPITPVDAR